jgi:hypothetical protein
VLLRNPVGTQEQQQDPRRLQHDEGST